MKHLLFFFFLSFSLTTFAQDRQIKGRITDDAGIPLQGVSVIPKGAQTGVQTDKDGNFTINVPGTDSVTLNFSYTGHKPTSIVTDGRSVVNVQLEKNPTTLDDVVVIGYQSIPKKNLLSSVSSISATGFTRATPFPGFTTNGSGSSIAKVSAKNGLYFTALRKRAYEVLVSLVMPAPTTSW